MSHERGITPYTQWQADRAQKLSRVSRTLDVGTKAIQDLSEEKVYGLLPPENGERRFIEVTPQFLYGVYLVRESIRGDLKEEGLEDVANDIVNST